ncbi:SMI1/KNR4 family protein [Pyxidicoccus fallax]|uniref:SMI1/KNR4 family protein n=1 Tax=Pyxidicoccus fallax TaxID=394095 RepID=A0A848L9Q8_9BACT|nr:SMI1/KNR4 family protein [Pyxidicoccus fallax]NMO15770.1 SMI1/KNR4 family protein [Pyxidicoccus fallax]NPC77308.1 SMI1/KNR4 family protein [Pyxidicoccus fallax]
MATLLRTSEGGPPLTDETLRSFERKYALVLPRTYREFLLATNGGRPERDLLKFEGPAGASPCRIHLFFGLNDPIESCRLDWNLEVFRERLSPHLLPIATTEGADLICLAVTGEQAGMLFYWDGYAREGERGLYFLAGDFPSLLSALHADELSPRIIRA